MNWSHPFRDVLEQELDGFGEEDALPGTLDPVLQRAHEARLAGIAFSGGGIRSATFNLGVLQGLADLKLLRKFHYLSTVSGGGYIGSWLVAWIYRRGGDLREVSSMLRSAWADHLSGRAPEEIRFLRRFSNYLTPKLGWLGADTWTVVAIYLRNVILNMTTLVAALAFILMLPRVLGVLMGSPLQRTSGPFSISAILFYLFLLCATGFISWNIVFLQKRRRDLWAGEPLGPKDKNVRLLFPGSAEAEGIAPNESQPNESQPNELAPAGSAPNDAVVLFRSEDSFHDFVLDLLFMGPDPATRFVVAARTQQANGVTTSAWEIEVGGEAAPKVAPPPGAALTQVQGAGASSPDRLRITCVEQSCEVQLHGRLVNVAPTRGPVLGSGRIEIRRCAGAPAPTLQSVLIRPLPEPPWASKQGIVQGFIVLPLLLAGLISVHWLGQAQSLSHLLRVPAPWNVWFDERQWGLWAGVCAFVLILAHAVELATGGYRQIRGARSTLPGAAVAKGKRIFTTARKIIWSVCSIAIGGAVGGLALAAFHKFLPAVPARATAPVLPEAGNFWPRLVLGPPAFIGAVSIMLILYIGLRGRDLTEEMREWWSRLGAWLLIYALLWIGLFGLALYSPPLLHWLAEKTVAALSLAWVTTTISGLIASRSAKTGRRTASPWRERMAAIAPYVFIVGLLTGLAWAINGIVSPSAPLPASAPLSQHLTTHWTALALAHRGVPFFAAMSDALRCLGHFFHQDLPLSGNCLLFLLLVLTFLVAGILGVCVDVNEFSMHMMYRNRLARCYLGASNARFRRAHAFTGFDQNDDIELAALAQSDWTSNNSGPYPIINCSLNLVGGHELAWQQRKAASFVFTPKYCGYDFSDLPPGYCRTIAKTAEKSARAYAASRTPLTLATAMAISGAAASPNMGYHTSPAPAFLMTLFNVRLGWWIGNPRSEKGWSRSAPAWALARLFAEMFGLTNAEGRYVYLSDGGHFENLGIFELVRRRCRFIIACDAEEDGDFGFEGLGNAIEKCRTDLGVEIELDVEAIRARDECGHSRWHCAVGRIRYDLTDPEAHAGTLLYLKSSLTGDESTDILRYAARNEAFPHESTMDQWFGESQFESYRALGQHVVLSAFAPVDEPENIAGLTTERLFVNLAQRWYRPGAALDPSFKRRGETLNAIYETLRTDKNLRFLSQQIYSGWRNLVEGMEDAPTPSSPPGPWLPETYEEMRAGFYFCNRLIILMEDIYHDLHLEQEHSHPDNRGWMNLFRHWAWSRMFRTTWTVSAANCGARFQNFCSRHLDLHVGSMELATLDLAGLMKAETQPAASPLTYVEWQLLHDFFREYPALLPNSRLVVFQLSPGSASEPEAADDQRKQPKFTAGFALLRKQEPGESGPQIIYFRIRDHMRRMGMARRAIYRLLSDNEGIGLDLHRLPGDAIQGDDEASHTLFRDLYRGVRIEYSHRGDRASGISE